jgi:digalactosyldiacylglycerol synthase
MGKWVLVEDIACNAFFVQFPNCLMYHTPEEFSDLLQRALTHEPSVMSQEMVK